MTNNLKCPFCGAELKHIKVMRQEAYACPNNCVGVHTPKVWQVLIDGKKAQDALQFISNIRGGMSYQDMFLDAHAVAKFALGQTSDLVLVGRYTQDQMVQITSINKTGE